MTFSDIEWGPHQLGGKHGLAFFPNGYGASIAQTPYSYGGKDGLYELAVLAGDARDWSTRWTRYRSFRRVLQRSVER